MDDAQRKIEMFSEAAELGRIDPNEAIDLIRLIDATRDEPKSKLTIPFYLSKLAGEELQNLLRWSNCAKSQSEPLADWLRHEAHREADRRESLETDAPIESVAPEIGETLEWTDAEVGGALKAVYLVKLSTRQPGLRQFFDKLLQFFVVLSARRLENR